MGGGVWEGGRGRQWHQTQGELHGRTLFINWTLKVKWQFKQFTLPKCL